MKSSHLALTLLWPFGSSNSMVIKLDNKLYCEHFKKKHLLRLKANFLTQLFHEFLIVVIPINLPGAVEGHGDWLGWAGPLCRKEHRYPKSNAPFKPHVLLSHHQLGLWCGRLKLMLARAETDWLPVELVCLQKVVAVTTLPGSSAEQNRSASRIRFPKRCELLESVCFRM